MSQSLFEFVAVLIHSHLVVTLDSEMCTFCAISIIKIYCTNGKQVFPCFVQPNRFLKAPHSHNAYILNGINLTMVFL